MKHLPAKILIYTFLVLVLVVMSGPVLTAFLGSIRTTGEFLASPFGLPKTGLHWENYTVFLFEPQFLQALLNSLLITGATSLLVVICSCLMGFIFARVDFRGKNLVFNIVSLALLFPLPLAFLPVFIQVREMGLINNFWGVILPLATFQLATTTIILRGFFRSIPKELEDASYIDGSSILGFFWYILLPLARPAIASVATISVIYTWNDYFLALLILNKEEQWPLPLGIMQFQGQYGVDWAPIMAYVTVLIIPALIFYLFAQRYVTTGVLGGELKG
jgi:raffinose/stachyose/melibiose transport system permease protein